MTVTKVNNELHVVMSEEEAEDIIKFISFTDFKSIDKSTFNLVRLLTIRIDESDITNQYKGRS